MTRPPDLGGHDDRPRSHDCRRADLESRWTRPGGLRCCGARARRALGGAALVDRTRASGRRTRRSRPRSATRLGWLDAPDPLHRAGPRPSRRSATRSRRGLHDRGRGRDGRQQPRPRVLGRTFGDSTGLARRCGSSTPPTRPRSRRPSDDLDPLRTLVHRRPPSRARRPSRSRSSPTPGPACEAALAARSTTTARHHRRRSSSRVTDPGKSVEAHPARTTTSARSSSTRPTSAAGTPP